MVRILHVIHSLDPRSGGPSHALRQLAQAQSRAGHEVAILATTTQSSEPWAPADEYLHSLRSDASFTGVELSVQPAWGRRRPWSRYAWSPASRRWLAHRLSDLRARPDVVHIHGVFSHITSSAAEEAADRGVPFIVRPTGALDRDCFASGRRMLKRLFARLALNRNLQRAAALQATSEAEAESLAAWVEPRRIRVVPLGVELPVLDERAGDLLRQRWPQLDNRRVVLFLSRVAPIKRAERLVAALAELGDRYADTMLVVAGQDAGGMPTLAEAVRRHSLAERVVFAGFLQGAEKQSAFALADVFALPSQHENFGMAVVEAMAHAVPVLVTPGVASHAYVDESGCGLTVDDQVPSLADGLRRLLAGDRSVLGRRGREYVERHLSWSSAVERLDRLYEAAIAGAPARTAVGAPA